MKKALWILSLLLVSFFTYHCKRISRPGAAETREIDSLIMKIEILEDSIDRAWQTMIEDDDEKHQFMKRLLLEVSYTNMFDKKRYAELNQMVDDLKDMRYTRATMRNSDLIDQYDSATFEVSRQVIEFALDHPSYEKYPLMAELIDDINNKNGMILIYRVHYDGFAIEKNHLIMDHREKLESKLKNTDIKESPLFQLSG